MFAWSGSSDTQKWLIHRSYFPSGRWTFFAFGKWFPSHHNTIAPKTKMWPVGFTQQRHLQHAPCWLGMRLHSHHVPRTARVVPLQRVQAGTISPLSTAAFGTSQGLTSKMPVLYQCCFQAVSLGIALSVKNSVSLKYFVTDHLYTISSLLSYWSLGLYIWILSLGFLTYECRIRTKSWPPFKISDLLS